MKYTFIQAHAYQHAVQTLCQVLGVSSSGYYDWLERPVSPRAASNLALLDEIKDIHEESKKRYGSPRVHAELKDRGRHVGRKRVGLFGVR